MTLLRFCLLHYACLSLMRINIFCSLQQHTTDEYIDQWRAGATQNMHVHVLHPQEAAISNTRGKQIGIGKQRNSPFVNIYCNETSLRLSQKLQIQLQIYNISPPSASSKHTRCACRSARTLMKFS